MSIGIPLVAVYALVGIIAFVGVIALHKQVLSLFGIVLIGEDEVGIVTKKFRLFGEHKSLPEGTILALNGEAGTQVDTLAPGASFWLWPWQYKVERVPLTIIPEGYVGVVESADGATIPTGSTFASHVECDNYQNGRSFLSSGGQRGIQLSVIRPGAYRINTALFRVTRESALVVGGDLVGVVTTFDGAPMQDGEIAGPIIANHDKWQNAQAFLDNGGVKGRQEEIIQAGTYYLNPRFVKVDLYPQVEVPIGHVGVVNAMTGSEPRARTDEEREEEGNARIVERGEKGVWKEVLDPRRYALNSFTHKVTIVPTTNIVLDWASNKKTGAQRLDSRLSSIVVRSSDGFSFSLDVSQIIHIKPDNAAAVISRFGSLENLIDQVLEPLIGNYFRNAAQSSDIIDFLNSRTEKQEEAAKAIAAAIAPYGVEAVDTLIGDIAPPEELMKTLTERKIAQENIATFAQQQAAADARTKFERANAEAEAVPQIVAAERSVDIAQRHAAASIAKAEGEAKSKTVVAQADALVIRELGSATAQKTLEIGEAEAKVIRSKVDAVGDANYVAIEQARLVTESGQALVPSVVAGGENGSTNALLALALTDKTKATEVAKKATKAS